MELKGRQFPASATTSWAEQQGGLHRRHRERPVNSRQLPKVKLEAEPKRTSELPLLECIFRNGTTFAAW